MKSEILETGWLVPQECRNRSQERCHALPDMPELLELNPKALGTDTLLRGTLVGSCSHHTYKGDVCLADIYDASLLCRAA
jgi:hypothetical protein